nr:hypothetical protein [Frigidibacter sp. SD6-1]
MGAGRPYRIGPGQDVQQVQRQTQIQKLSLTQSMRTSLSLLAMDGDEALHAIRREQGRNSFLRAVSPTLSGGGGGEADRPGGAHSESATDDLLRQISLIRLSPRQNRLAQDLVHSLDERGFLPDSPEETAGYLKCSQTELGALLPILQESVEPAGIFAWSLADSFRLQLQAKNRFDPLIERLLGRLDLIARQDIDGICTAGDIRSLNPSPLARQSHDLLPTGQPELIISANSDGSCSASLNEAALPRLLTDDALFSTTMAAEADAHAQSYYRDRYRGAASMVRAMQKRANTLLAAGQAIADHQPKYIRTGRLHDKLPLTMAQLADRIGVNKSTISRALSNCRISTELGILPAGHFLARPVSDDAPNGHATIS